MTKFYSLLCLSFVTVTLTACKQPAQNTGVTPTQTREETSTAPETTETGVEAAVEATTKVSKEGEDITSDPGSADSFEFSLQDSLGLINGFKLNSEPSFANCTYTSLINCQDQVANEKAVTEKSADACESIMDEN